MDGHSNVLLEHLDVRGFHVGLHASNMEWLRLSNSSFEQISATKLLSTPAAENSADWLWPHDNEQGQWIENYGGAVAIERSTHVDIQGVAILPPEVYMARRSRRTFSDEFKSETVKLVKRSDRSMSDIARELGISAKSMGEWVRLATESGSGDEVSEDERAELKRLRKENSELRMEKEILRKATAFFAKESR